MVPKSEPLATQNHSTIFFLFVIMNFLATNTINPLHKFAKYCNLATRLLTAFGSFFRSKNQGYGILMVWTKTLTFFVEFFANIGSYNYLILKDILKR